MNTVAGHCGKCGAPYYVPTVWHGITPPPATPSCMCWNQGKTYTTTDLVVETDTKPTARRQEKT